MICRKKRKAWGVETEKNIREQPRRAFFFNKSYFLKHIFGGLSSSDMLLNIGYMVLSLLYKLTNYKKWYVANCTPLAAFTFGFVEINRKALCKFHISETD